LFVCDRLLAVFSKFMGDIRATRYHCLWSNAVTLEYTFQQIGAFDWVGCLLFWNRSRFLFRAILVEDVKKPEKNEKIKKENKLLFLDVGRALGLVRGV
jgi:hypothetical protein